MSKVIAQYFFNPIFQPFLLNYAACYGQYCPHVVDHVLPEFTNKINVKPKYADFIMQKMIDSFKSENETDDRLVKLLKNFETFDQLILVKENYAACEFLRMLQINKIWSRLKEEDDENPEETKYADENSDDENEEGGNSDPYRRFLLDRDDRFAIFRHINSMYLICQGTMVFPVEVRDKIDQDARQHAAAMQESKRIDMMKIKNTGVELLKFVRDSDIVRIFDFLQEFCLSESTPIFGILPESFHQTAENFIKMMRVKSARKALATQLKPFLRELQNGAVFQKYNEEYTVGDENDEDATSRPAFPNETGDDEVHSKRRDQTIAYMIDIVVGVLDRHEELVMKLATDPSKAMAMLKEKGMNNIVKEISDEFQHTTQEINARAASLEQSCGASLPTGTGGPSSNNSSNNSLSNARATVAPTYNYNYSPARPQPPNNNTNSSPSYTADDNYVVVNNNEAVQNYFSSLEGGSERIY